MDKKIRCPERMCIACKSLINKDKLLRIAKSGDLIFIDTDKSYIGRGAYMCQKKECISITVKKNYLNKAFRCSVPDEINNKLIEIASLLDESN